MESNSAVVLGFGLLVLLVAWLPTVLRRVALSLPIVCVAIGAALHLAGLVTVDLDHLHRTHLVEHLTEAVLLISLMGAGLNLDRPVGWVRWSTTWRLLGIGMPLMMVGTALAAMWLGGLALGGAVLLAGALAPTDPVLAADVAVGPPGKGEEGEIRFGLTSEAGLNDGLAFPVVMLAIALIEGTRIDAGWIAMTFGYKVLAGIAIGWVTGRAMGWLTFRVPGVGLSSAASGLVAIGITAVSYALTELAGGFGFLAVFLSALALRATEPEHDFHREMSDFSGQVERVLVMLVLVLFGAVLTSGMLASVTWREVGLAAVLLFVLRPLTTWIAMIGSPAPPVARATIAFFGIRGVGTLYYLVYATAQVTPPEEPRLLAIAGLTVLGSILIHGLTATPLMQRIDRLRDRAIRENRYPEAQVLTES